jgi:cation diffusion facilitator CzcD-associated flavoprotein CzcO
MAKSLQQTPAAGTGPVDQFDAIIIGAGLTSLYQLYRLRQLGLSV